MPKTLWRRNNDCEAHKLLVGMFERKEITAKSSPIEVWKSNSEFQKYGEGVFRNVFGKLKLDYGIPCKLV